MASNTTDAAESGSDLFRVVPVDWTGQRIADHDVDIIVDPDRTVFLRASNEIDEETTYQITAALREAGVAEWVVIFNGDVEVVRLEPVQGETR